MVSIASLASFPGSSAPERKIELVHAERAWYFFSHVRTLKGRKAIDRKTLNVHGRTLRLRTGKRAKVVGSLLPISSIPSAECKVG